MARVRFPTSTVRLSLQIGSIATQTQCGERDKHWIASVSVISPSLTALSKANSSPICTCSTLQNMAGEGFEVLGRFDQPVQNDVGIDFKDSGHGADAEAFGQSRNGPLWQPRQTSCRQRRPLG
jgi:hypothetical protein